MIWGQFHQTFLPNKKLPAHGVQRIICHSISYKKLRAKSYRSKFAKSVHHLPNAVCQKRRRILHAKNSRKNVDEIDPLFWMATHFLEI
jgi:hypothetical protein